MPSLFLPGLLLKKDPNRTLLNRIDQVKDEFQRSMSRFSYHLACRVSLASQVLQLLPIMVSYCMNPVCPVPWEPRAGKSEFGGSFPKFRVWRMCFQRSNLARNLFSRRCSPDYFLEKAFVLQP